MSDRTREHCPKCGALMNMDKHDGGHEWTERQEVCSAGCGWTGRRMVLNGGCPAARGASVDDLFAEAEANLMGPPHV